MQSEPYEQQFQALWQRLQALANLAIDAPAPTLQAALREIQDFFQHRILELSLEELEPKRVAKIQSYQTEISKQLRLLNMDGMFLQTARQSATATQRRQQIGDRINTLIRYCEAVLEESTPSSEP